MSNKALREAFANGAFYWGAPLLRAEEEARRRYPPKTEIRAREITVTTKAGHDFLYRFDVGGGFLVRGDQEEHFSKSGLVWLDKNDSEVVNIDTSAFTPEDAARLVDLMQNPTETVEVDD